MNDIVEDLIHVNKGTFKKAAALLKKNYFIIFMGFIYSVINIVSFKLLGVLFSGMLYMIGGFAATLVNAAIISSYLFLLYNILFTGTFTADDFKQGFTIYLWKIYGVFFILWIASIFLPGRLSLIVYLLCFIVLNALPEALYQKNFSSWDSMRFTLQFMRENWIEWLAPNSIFLVTLLILFSSGSFHGIYTARIIQYPGAFAFRLFMFLFSQMFLAFVMIYRGVLFHVLSSTTLRNRTFRRRAGRG